MAHNPRYSAPTPINVPDMTIIDGNRRPAPPLPLECFRAWAPWIEQTAEARSAPLDYVATALLATAAALVGNARAVSPWPDWIEPGVLWVALVGNPSSGKSPALDAALAPIRVLEEELAADFPETVATYKRDAERAKAEYAAWKQNVEKAVKEGLAAPDLPAKAEEPERPVMPRLIASDVTIEALAQLLCGNPRGILAYRDELAGWLGNFDRYGGAGGDRAFWIEAFGGRSYTVDRVKLEKPIQIRHLAVSVVGGIQPDRLASLLAKADDDGLASRFLMTWPDPVRPRRPRMSSGNVATPWLRKLVQIPIGTNGTIGTWHSKDDDGFADDEDHARKVVALADDAADLFQQWREENATKERDAAGLYLSHLGKLPGLVLRIALALEYLEWAATSTPEPQSVSRASVGYAACLVDDYYAPMALRCYGDAALTSAEKGAAAVARRILKDRPQIINARVIRRDWKLPGLKEARDVNAALDLLTETNWLFPMPEREGGGHGRQRADYHVNRRVFE